MEDQTNLNLRIMLAGIMFTLVVIVGTLTVVYAVSADWNPWAVSEICLVWLFSSLFSGAYYLALMNHRK